MVDKLLRQINRDLASNPEIDKLIARVKSEKRKHPSMGTELEYKAGRLPSARKPKSLPGQMDLF